MLVQYESCMISAYVLMTIHSLKLVDYLPVNKHKQYKRTHTYFKNKTSEINSHKFCGHFPFVVSLKWCKVNKREFDERWSDTRYTEFVGGHQSLPIDETTNTIFHFYEFLYFTLDLAKTFSDNAN